jgi:hypothetical protein
MLLEVNMFEFQFFMFGLFLMALWVLSKPARDNRHGEWHVKIDTNSPEKHTYELGPYDSREEASKSSTKYIRDLEINEGVNKMKINIKHDRQSDDLIAS